ncbi:hypothetical protein L1987_15493 [Smallanthus sonchifolius]|uniref:Uncharacterized protein n=1 Tax=Smallanthus sonchifolius TaxID=185202 RepID=A0ACB9J6R4_9ASTR|nr:hypothetical protein L1987_15493 [Smallanthus sonchifolius]
MSQKDECIMNSNGENCDFEDVVYLYKLVPGVSERSFGFKVAQLAQLPLSCINRASAMSMKLDEAVGSRPKSKLAQKNLQESDGSGDTKALKEMYSNLKLAFSEGVDPAKSFQSLKHARNPALELINRQTTLHSRDQ